ncbi:hypothetical protein DFS34DRAFT_601202 [Phlyctochytrium arcticum]|nr:hypothetical protein DFS34DRAFT_601202 [Phlyctochytrium arcticum]
MTLSSHQQIAITAAAAGFATVALLVLGPLSQDRTVKVTKRKLETPPSPSLGSAAPLSASWSFVDQSTSALVEAANTFRAREHAERIFTELVDPETYYEVTRQPEFGVEVIGRSSGHTRFIRKRRSRQSRGQRITISRTFGEDENGPNQSKSYFIVDEFKVFNTQVRIRHLLYLEDGDVPSVTIEVQVDTSGPPVSAWIIGRRYFDQVSGVGNAVELRWDGKTPVGTP